MPKLWTETVESHRIEVREAILDAAGELVHSQGMLAVTMSQIAEVAGIGRATLYKYFADAEEVLSAWHGRHVTAHLDELASVGDRGGAPVDRLRAVLSAYARICTERGCHHSELRVALHRSDAVTAVQQQLLDLVTGLVSEASAMGAIRDDVPASLLASYCIHALTAAGDIAAARAQATLVDVVWAGLTPNSKGGSW